LEGFVLVDSLLFSQGINNGLLADCAVATLSVARVKDEGDIVDAESTVLAAEALAFHG
jgi:hypothetical protein